MQRRAATTTTTDVITCIERKRSFGVSARVFVWWAHSMVHHASVVCLKLIRTRVDGCRVRDIGAVSRACDLRLFYVMRINSHLGRRSSSSGSSELKHKTATAAANV